MIPCRFVFFFQYAAPPNFLFSPNSLTKPTKTTALPPICLTTGSFHFPSHSQPNRLAPLHSRLQQQLLAGDRPTVSFNRSRSFFISQRRQL